MVCFRIVIMYIIHINVVCMYEYLHGDDPVSCCLQQSVHDGTTEFILVKCLAVHIFHLFAVTFTQGGIKPCGDRLSLASLADDQYLRIVLI